MSDPRTFAEWIAELRRVVNEAPEHGEAPPEPTCVLCGKPRWEEGILCAECRVKLAKKPPPPSTHADP